MQLSWPYPLRSPLDPDVPYYDKDYSMTSPLLADGSDFSCKHYQQNYTDTNVTKATYVAGGTYDMWVNGTATHDGGSCQLSLSYDNGVTFKVIKSIIGGCPLPRTYSFTVPSYAPSSDTALFSWTWFNLVGNREMYQNCARVQIVSNPAQKYRRTPFKRQASIDDLPDIFTCNIGNDCQTIEGAEIVFPNPGSDVVYGQDEITAAAGPGYTISGSTTSSTSDSTSAVTSASAGLTDSPATTSTLGLTTEATTTTGTGPGIFHGNGYGDIDGALDNNHRPYIDVVVVINIVGGDKHANHLCHPHLYDFFIFIFTHANFILHHDYVYIFVHLYLFYVYGHRYGYGYGYGYSYVYSCVYSCVNSYSYAYLYIYSNIYPYIHIHDHKHKHVDLYVRIHLHLYIYIHVHVRTHVHVGTNNVLRPRYF
ncbi:hypothetical protein A1O3_05343 [Capronia epimyces CBS 606.96]|uniref:Uncharacterized protein n=1 Tax=Capronia epimyces CBS 606.96 TaxID=1182542 RepID=W9XWR2_9EURO|nr:uncharacterized protein A1O3_05343 [Capronia epimyces CBS 606.96]EXJ84673.1 hypothetical protein A1O3_05343 [Capronia epimyces CBS 606.96]